MQRSRLKNIINKSKELSNLLVREPYDLFVETLPTELNYYKDGGKYRLKAAWNAYGKPKNYQEALWNGLVETIGDNFKMPSIGYNEETNSYEYLNKGKDNDIVNKDIRAWDNNIIPFIKELKQGGYVRTFDEEKDCWTYSKNTQSKTENLGNEIDFLKQGGKKTYSKHKESDLKKEKTTYEEWIKDLNPDYMNDNYDLETAYKYYPAEMLERWKWAVNRPTLEERNYWMDYTEKDENGNNYYPYHLGSIVRNPEDDSYIFLKKGRESENPELKGELDSYYNGLNGLKNTHDLIFDPELNRYFYRRKNPQAFKQGGLMNVIPEGALHARKNNMELAKEGLITSKGIPVIDNEGNQLAEVEKEEWTMTKELTEDVERWYKKFYNEETSNKEKDELAIKCGKRLVDELLRNTEDRAGLIDKIANEI